MNLQEIIEQIAIRLVAFTKDYEKTTSKAAMQRARKATLELTKLFKEYRKESIKK